jgi:hypothetical protein
MTAVVGVADTTFSLSMAEFVFILSLNWELKVDVYF